jgi:hypothetical protein
MLDHFTAFFLFGLYETILLMKKYLIILLFLNTAVMATVQLDNLCERNKGTIVKSFTCPKSKLKLPIKTCIYKNKSYDTLFVNGCSGPSGGFGKSFFKACIAHDLCYHHEPSSNGADRKSCDQKFLNIALEECSNFSGDTRKDCRGWAKTMYYSLRVIGLPAFNCADYPADY